MNDVPKAVDDVLAVLAERFGSTGAHLWEVLIRQAYVEAVVAGLAFAALATAASFCAKGTYTAWKDPLHRDANVFFAIGGPFVILAAFVMLLAFIGSLSGALNPEYFALRKVLGVLP